MTTLPAYVDAVIPGLKQGVDMMVPLVLELPEGETDTSVLTLAATDTALMHLRTTLRQAEPDYVFSTAAGNIVIKPEANSIELYFTDTASRTFKLSGDGLIVLFGTLLVDDAQGNSRPCSGVDLRFDIEPSFTR